MPHVQTSDLTLTIYITHDLFLVAGMGTGEGMDWAAVLPAGTSLEQLLSAEDLRALRYRTVRARKLGKSDEVTLTLHLDGWDCHGTFVVEAADHLGDLMLRHQQSSPMTVTRQPDYAALLQTPMVQTLLESRQQFSVLMDRFVRVLDWNHLAQKQGTEFFGVPLHKGMNMLDIVQERDRAELLPKIRQCLGGEKVQFVKPLGLPNGDSIHLSILLLPLTDSEGHIFGLGMFAQDITRVRQLDRQVSDQGEKLQELADALDKTAILTETDGKGTILHVNELFEMSSLYTAEEVLGKNMNILNSGYHTSALFKDMFDHLHRGKVYQNELRNRKKNGELFWVRTTIFPRMNSKGALHRCLCIQHDITPEKDAQDKLINWNMELKKRNTELDRFVYSTSHQFRGPIASILGLLKLSQAEETSDTISSYLEMIERSILGLDKTSREIAQYLTADRQRIEKQNLDLGSIVDEVMAELHYMPAAQRVRVEVNGIEEVPFYSDYDQVKLLLQNLLSNSLQFYDPEKEDNWVKVGHYSFRDHAFLVVADNGIGIEADQQPKIFDLFQRSSERSKGTGLGMYVVHNVVRRLGGRVDIDSQVSEGTSINVELPQRKQR